MNASHFRTLVLAGLVSSLVGGTVLATAPAAAAPAPRVAFVMEVNTKALQTINEIDLLQIKIGTLAAARGQTQEVKDLAALVAADHTKANADLKALATAKSLAVADVIPANQQKLYDRLSETPVAAFDKHLIGHIIESNETAIHDLEHAAKEVSDPDVKAFIEKLLPIYRSHLDKAKAIKKARAY
jgi:putative membrane protein